MGLTRQRAETRRGMKNRNFNHNRAPGQARDRAIADWPEGRGSGHERVKETEDTELEEGSRAEAQWRGGRRNTKIVSFGFYSRGFAAFAGKTNAGGDAHPP